MMQLSPSCLIFQKGFEIFKYVNFLLYISFLFFLFIYFGSKFLLEASMFRGLSYLILKPIDIKSEVV